MVVLVFGVNLVFANIWPRFLISNFYGQVKGQGKGCSDGEWEAFPIILDPTPFSASTLWILILIEEGKSTKERRWFSDVLPLDRSQNPFNYSGVNSNFSTIHIYVYYAIYVYMYMKGGTMSNPNPSGKGISGYSNTKSLYGDIERLNYIIQKGK